MAARPTLPKPQFNHRGALGSLFLLMAVTVCHQRITIIKKDCFTCHSLSLPCFFSRSHNSLCGQFRQVGKLSLSILAILLLNPAFSTAQQRTLESRMSSSAEKKLADFGTSNNIATSAFNSLINRTKMFLVSYCNLSNN